MKKTKLIALLLALLMLTGCADLLAPFMGENNGGYIENEYFTYKVPESVDFNSLSYVSADMDKIEATYKELGELGTTATDFSQIVEKFNETEEFAYDMLTNGTIANAHYSLDRTNSQYEANDLEATENRIAATTMSEEAFLEVLGGPYKDEFRELIGEEYADNLIESGAKSDEHVALLEEEALLIQEYNELYLVDYTYEFDGVEWTLDMVFDPVTSAQVAQEDLYEIYNAISYDRNYALATVFSDLIEIRKQIAVFEGYDNYADYAYADIFDRDYTPAEAMELNNQVSEFVAPLYEEANSAMYSQYYDFEISSEYMMSTVKENLLEISPLFEEPFDYMIDNNLFIYTEDASTAYNGAFCSDLYAYDAPLMFMLGQSGTYNVKTLVHEFGHYAEAYYNTFEEDEPSTTLDIAEVHSTALEMLMYHASYEEIFDDSTILYADILSKLSIIVDSSMFDDFLQQVYASDHKLTVDEINQIFFTTESKYRPITNSWGYSWTDVPHSFEVPFYYLSYGVATLHAMDIFRVAEESGIEVATDLYFELMAESMEDLEYSEVMENIDMRTFKDDGYVESIISVIETELQNLAG